MVRSMRMSMPESHGASDLVRGVPREALEAEKALDLLPDRQAQEDAESDQ